MIETKIENWGLDKIKPGRTNPRTDFNEEALAELSDSVATHGILQPLVTRPDWCIGKTPGEIAQINGNAPPTKFLEIVAGERRYRAAVKAKLETAPVSIRLFSDQDVLEIHLIENLQREDLDAFEEAAGYRQLLDLRDANGAKIHTVVTIASRVHKDRARVYHRMKLLNVPPAMRAAVRAGLGVRIAEFVGEIPTKEMREAATAEILKPTDPSFGVGPLTVLQARQLIETRFNRQLSAAQFDQKDATLVPVIQDDQTGERIGGGACKDCPMRTGNMEAIIGKTTRPDVCTNPQCFARKTDAQFARLQENAVAEGKKILTAAEAADTFDEDGSIYLDSDFVKLSDQPDRQEVRSDFTGKFPSWKKLLENLEVKPQIFISRDPKGRIVELVDRALAIEAINLAAKGKGERSIFDKSPVRSGTSASSSSASSSSGSGGGGFGGGSGGVSDQDRKNREIAKVNFQITLACMSAVIAAIDDKGGQPAGFWDELIKASITHAGHDGCWLICKRHGLDAKLGKRVDGIAGEGVEGAALEYGLTLPDEKMKIGYVVELLISQRVKFSNSGSMGGVRSVKTFTSFAKLYGVDLAAVEKQTRETAKEKKAPKSKADGAPPGEMHWTRKPEGDFTFNEHGVCEKPATLVLPFPKTTRVRIVLYVARSKSGWVGGSDVELGGTGVGSGGASSLPSKSSDRKSGVFPTAQKALEHELIGVDFQLVSMQAKPAVLKNFRAYVREIKGTPVTEPVPQSKPAEHEFEKITGNKYRCKGCGAAAVKVIGKKSSGAESTKVGLLLVAKQFRGKPCSQAELPLGDVTLPAKKSKSKPKKSATDRRKPGLTPAGRKKLTAAMKARWAAARQRKASKSKGGAK